MPHLPDSVVPRRIWLVAGIESLPIDGVRGLLMRMGRLAQALGQAGHQVTWWESSFSHYTKMQRATTGDVLVAEGVRLRLVPTPSYSGHVSVRRVLAYRALARNFRIAALQVPEDERPDVIVTPLHPTALARTASRVAKELGAAFVVDIRDLYPDVYTLALPRRARPIFKAVLPALRLGVRPTLRRATALVAISPSFLDWARRVAGRGPRDTDRFFPIGFSRKSGEDAPDPQDTRGRLTRMGVDPARKILLFAGQLNRIVDLHPLVAAAADLEARRPGQFQVVIAGSGEQLESLKASSVGGVGVVLPGWLDTRDLAAVKSVAWLGVTAYLPIECAMGIGNKVFEYMAAGLPVASSIAGDVGELLSRHGCGFTYDPSDPSTLVRRVLSLADDRNAYLSLSDAARRAAGGVLSSAEVYAEMATFLARLSVPASSARTQKSS